METEQFEISPFADLHREQLLVVWEKSVLATHHFLKSEDFETIKDIVHTIDFNQFSVYCLLNKDQVIGFIGIADHSIEMLFLAPEYHGKGLGRKLILFAIDELNADNVEVNEQNVQAVEFYEKFGFVTYDRMEKDTQGMDYPLLKMKLGR